MLIKDAKSKRCPFDLDKYCKSENCVAWGPSIMSPNIIIKLAAEGKLSN